MTTSHPATMEDITRGQYAKILARAKLATAWREEYTEKLRETTLFHAELLEDTAGVSLSWFCYRVVRAVVEELFQVDTSSVFEATEDIYASGNCEAVDIQLIKEKFKANALVALTLEDQWGILSPTLHTGTSAAGPSSEPAPKLQPPRHLPATLAEFNAMTVREIQEYQYDIPDGVDYARDIAPLARRLHGHTKYVRFGHASAFGIRAYREGPKSGLEFASMALVADMRVRKTHSVILEWLADIMRMEADQRIPQLASYWDQNLIYTRDMLIVEEKAARDKLGDMSQFLTMKLRGPPKVLPENIYYSGDMKPESLEATYAANWRDPSWIHSKPSASEGTE